MNEYLRTAWYVAAWEQDLAKGGMLARTLLGVPRVLFRKSDGSYALLEDRCPHRFAPLSKGTLEHDAITCLYHGLQFNGDGKCIHNPSTGSAEPRASVPTLPVVARHGLLWFWPGEPAAADPARIPDFSFLDRQDIWRRYSHFNAHFELLTDNLMDLSHVDFLHRNTFKTNGAHARGRHEVKDGAGSALISTWYLPGVRHTPLFEAHFAADEIVDQTLEMRWHAPASMSLALYWHLASDTAANARFSMINPHIITPETATSSHYFWTCFPNADAEALALAVFDGEDKPMIEAVQSRMGSADFWSLRPMILKPDLASVRARRRLLKLRHLEAGDAAAAASAEITE